MKSLSSANPQLFACSLPTNQCSSRSALMFEEQLWHASQLVSHQRRLSPEGYRKCEDSYHTLVMHKVHCIASTNLFIIKLGGEMASGSFNNSSHFGNEPVESENEVMWINRAIRDLILSSHEYENIRMWNTHFLKSLSQFCFTNLQAKTRPAGLLATERIMEADSAWRMLSSSWDMTKYLQWK